MAVTAFSWGFVIVKAVDLPGAQIGLIRVLIGTAVLGSAAVALRMPWPQLTKPVVLAGITFGLHQILFIEATKHTSIAIVTLVGALQPLLVAVLSRRTLGEAVPRALLGCGILAVAGVGIVVQASAGDASRSLFGDVLAGVNLLAFTAYFLSSKRARDLGAPTLTLTATIFAVSALVLLPVVLLVGLTGALPVRMPTAGEAGLLVVMALAPGNGHLLLNWAHSRVTAALSSLVLALVPILASLWAALVFGEPYGPWHLVGMVLVVIAIDRGRRIERRGLDDALAIPPN